MHKQDYLIRQGDQYALPIILWQGETLIEDSDVEAMRIAVGPFTAYYPGALSYSSQLGAWLFPLTEEMTYALSGKIRVQAQAQFLQNGETVCISSDNVTIDVDESELKGAWIE